MAEERPVPQLRGGRALRFIGGVEVAAVGRCLARGERANHGYKEGEDVFHARDGIK
jgi:hypothetical protein